MSAKNRIHKTAEISKKAKLGSNVQIWNEVQIRQDVVIGNNCILGKGVYIDKGCRIGNNIKIQNYASIYRTTIVEDSVFIGPYVCFTNDTLPRSTDNNALKNDSEWLSGTCTVCYGASIGASSVILPDITIGEYAMVGAGSVVTKDVGPHQLVFGNPATLQGYVCVCGAILSRGRAKPILFLCKECQKKES